LFSFREPKSQQPVFMVCSRSLGLLCTVPVNFKSDGLLAACLTEEPQ